MNINGSVDASSRAPFDPTSVQQGSMSGTNMGKEDFLELLVAQLGNQDPLNPTDATEFVAQLSQFTSLEQLVNIRDGLDLLAITETAGTSAQMVSFIGKEIVYEDDTVVRAAGDGPSPLDFNLEQSAASLTVTIKDESGRTVRTMNLGPHDEGLQSVTWNGKDDEGNELPEGSYRFEVQGTNAAGETFDVTTRATRRVTGVSFQDGYPQLVLEGGESITLGQVREVIGAAESLSATATAAAEASLSDLATSEPSTTTTASNADDDATNSAANQGSDTPDEQPESGASES